MTVFIPLRLHSEYSLENGMVRLPEAVAFAVREGFYAMALSDRMNLFGMIKFYTACQKNGIVPIIGVVVEMAPLAENLPSSELLLLAKNHQGYLQLCQWLTDAYLTETRALRPQLSWSVIEQGSPNLICLSGATQGGIGQALLRDKMTEAVMLAEKLAQAFPDSFYLEIQRLPEEFESYGDSAHQKTYQRLRYEANKVLIGSLKIAEKLDLPPVATHPVMFMQPEDFTAHEARVCIAQGEILNNPRRSRVFHPGQFFLSQEQMRQLFEDLPEALENSVHIAKRCQVSITLGKHFLPLFPTPEGMSLDDYLESCAHAGLEERLQLLYPDEALRQEKRPDYEQRLNYELGIIESMGFPGYFLIVADFINWAKNNGCPVGPGRGSGAGSLVAYTLKITDLDPLRYDLLFERFLNPERVSMPDFDVDFCQENRNRVIDYVRDKYGHDAVSQIVTFGTLSSKAVVRDVGRVLDIPFPVCDRLSKLIPVEQNKPLSLKDALAAEPEMTQLIQAEGAEELWSLALKLEDLVRGVGMHAGGVLIAPGKLTDFCPVYRANGSDAASVSMYDKNDVEEAGLVKFDFLGLRNLTIIRLTEQYIADYQHTKIDSAHVPLDDAAVYDEIFAKANTTAVFQFESVGMKRMLQEAKPTKFEEIIAFVALYRPGPMDLIPDFIARMHGKQKFEYLHPLLAKMLEPTYGIMVYQEQVMQAAQLCAGYSLGAADMLRRAMGKKKPEEMAKQRAFFVAGAKEKGIDDAKANEIFDYMEKFAGYGFNKSHAAAYALVAYQTAWLKHYYPAEFIAATMSCDMDNTDQLKIFHDDALAHGITFLPPSINHSEYRFIPTTNRSIRYALGAVKGGGEAAIQAIVSARQSGGAFTDLFDFCCRVGKQNMNRRTLEALIRAGAFDEIDANRARLLANVGAALEYAEQQNANRFQGGLFEEENIVESIGLADAPAWLMREQLNAEKNALGFYFSAHPFVPYANEMRYIAPLDLAHLQPSQKPQWLAGFVTHIRKIIGKTGMRTTIVEIEDGSAKREIMVRDEVYEQYGHHLVSDCVLIFECKVQADDYTGIAGALRLSANCIQTPDEAREKRARRLQLQLRDGDDIATLAALLRQHQQGERLIPVEIHYHNGKQRGLLNADSRWCVAPQQALLDELERLLGHGHYQLCW